MTALKVSPDSIIVVSLPRVSGDSLVSLLDSTKKAFEKVREITKAEVLIIPHELDITVLNPVP